MNRDDIHSCSPFCDRPICVAVREAVAAEREAQIAAVNAVLKEIGADHIPQVLIYNKIDLTAFEPQVESDGYGKIHRVWISAVTGQGLDLLRNVLGQLAEARLEAAQSVAA